MPWKNTNDNIFLEAFAGCGKSSTIAESVKFVTGKIVLLTFGKIASQDLESKVKPNNESALVATIHSLAYKIVKGVMHRMSVNTDKYQTIVKNCPLIAEDDRKVLSGQLVKMVTLLQANNLESNEKNIKFILDRYTFEIEYNNHLLQVVNYIWDEGLRYNESGIFSFDDLLYFAVTKNLLNKFYDVLYIDEAQDLSPLNISFVKNLAKRVVFVGDRYQSIYGFRGADINSIENLIDTFKPQILPLSYTFRCPQNIVNKVNDSFSEIGIKSKKIGGILENIAEVKLIQSILTKNSAMILCAYNAPLVKYVYELIRQGKKAIIRGKDISIELINFITMIERKYQVSSIRELSESMDKYYNSMVEKYTDKAAFLDILKDKIDVINIISENTDSVNGIISELNNIFSDDTNNEYVFSSIHKSKGLEHNTIYMLQEKLIYKKAVTDNEKRQAKNLHYVGLTRSKNELYIVE